MRSLRALAVLLAIALLAGIVAWLLPGDLGRESPANPLQESSPAPRIGKMADAPVEGTRAPEPPAAAEAAKSPETRTGLRVRILRGEGVPAEEGDIVLIPLSAGSVDPLVAYRRQGGAAQVSVLESGGARWGFAVADRPGKDEASFEGLRSGAEYLVLSAGLPGSAVRVRVPANATSASVDLDLGRFRTDCVLRFTVDGEEPEYWDGLAAGPALPDEFSTGKGILEAAIPPGKHRFAVQATMEPDGKSGTYFGEVEIPDSARFDSVVDLKPLGR